MNGEMHSDRIRFSATGLLGAVLMLLTAFAAPPATAQSDEPREAGYVERIRGVAEVDQLGGRGIRLLETGSKVFSGDRIITGIDTRVLIRLRDDTTFTLGDLTSITIDDFIYNPDRDAGNAAFNLAKGVFRMVTGAVGKLPGAPLTVRTPVATIGIRGTDFWGHQSASRLELALLDGAGVYAENAAGRVEITEPGFVTVIAGPDQVPTEPVRLPPEVLQQAAETVSF